MSVADARETSNRPTGYMKNWEELIKSHTNAVEQHWNLFSRLKWWMKLFFKNK